MTTKARGGGGRRHDRATAGEARMLANSLENPYSHVDGRYAAWALRSLAAQVEELLAAVRKHRDQRGDDRCWMDDEELYKALPEGYAPPARDSAVQLKMCEKFIASRRNPATTYVSPQRRIDELEAEVAKLRAAFRIIKDTANKLDSNINSDGATCPSSSPQEDRRGAGEKGPAVPRRIPVFNDQDPVFPYDPYE